MLDVEGIVCRWINTRDDFTGPGKPLDAGAHLKYIRHQGTYAFIIAVGTPVDLTEEVPIARARISATIFGRTKEAASRGAIAYGSVLERIQLGNREKMGDYWCIALDNISGPLPVDDQQTTREQFRYLVDADFWIAAQGGS